MRPETIDLILALQAARTFDEAWAAAERYFQNTGAEWLAYGYETEDGLVLKNSYPAEWGEHYQSSGLVHHDFATRLCLSQTSPFRFGIEWEPGDASPEAHQVCLDAADFGLFSGVYLPLRMDAAGLRKGGLGFSNGMKADEFGKYMKEREAELVLALALCNSYLQKLVATRDRPMIELSPREREVLTWVANGGSAKIIAHKLGIAARTVEHHIASAQKRLGASNSANAVAEAIKLNLIQP